MKQRLIDAFRDVLRVGAIMAIVATAAGVLLFHVWNQYRLTRLGYEIADVTHEHRRLIERNKKLRIEVAVQGRTERMAVVAGERFGLEPVRPEQVQPITREVADGQTFHATEHASLVP